MAATGGAAGGVAYAKGDLETNLDAPPDKVAQAAEAALRDEGLSVLSSRSARLTARLLLDAPQDKKVTIKVRKLTDTTSHISIRVGVFGDQSMSYALLDMIKAKL